MRYNIKQDLGEFVFCQYHKALDKEPKYHNNLSNEAKLLYMYMYDKNKISIQNGWCDENGDIYIYFSVQAIMKALKVSNRIAIKRKKELAAVGLIEEVRQSSNKPNIIYVNVPEISEKSLEVYKSHYGGVEKSLREVYKSHTNNNEKNNNKIISITETQTNIPAWADWD